MSEDISISMAPSNTNTVEPPEETRTKTKTRTLGNVRLRDRRTNEVILIPTPSNDPNDPLNWSQGYKYYMAVLVCFAMLICNFLAAGPTVAIVETTVDFFPSSPLSTSISKVAYFFTATALLQGTGNFIWMPLANKFGRRPVYVTSEAIYLVTAIWLIFEKSYGGFLAGRIIMGFGSGAAETIAPVSISDVFFLHERGTIMSLYTSFLSVGVAFGVLVDGLILIHNGWRVIYQVAAALVGLVFLLAFFTFPETAYRRTTESADRSKLMGMGELDRVGSADAIRTPPPAKVSYWHSLRIYHKTLTEESLTKMVIRPLGLICLPPVLWASLVQAVTVGFLVAVTSNVATAFQTAYGFEAWQVGLCFIAAIIGSLVGIPAGGVLGDKVADWFTKRNGGIREPEMRLPGMMLCLLSTPLSLILYGEGIANGRHWMCPTIGLGLLNFSITQGTNICLVYVIDAYRPIAGEITLTVMGFKSLFGFLLSFYTNPWIDEIGYEASFGTMAAIAAFILLMWIPLFFYGKAIRHVTWNWRVLSAIRWTDDREVGE